MKKGCALYDAVRNELEVVRPGESITRRIKCVNMRPEQDRVFGLEIDGDDIWLLIGPKNNQRPNRKINYKFSSLSGGSSRGL